MSSRLSYLHSCKRFVTDMVNKHTDLLKEWQKNAVERLNSYCRGEIALLDFCNFIKSYNIVLLKYEYWCNQLSFVNSELLEARGYAKLNDSNCED